jgi:SAM-dependent methyltransferase
MPLNIKNIYTEQQFRPGYLGLFVNPFYFARRGIYRAVLNFASHASGSLLDVGCGSKPYKSVFAGQVDQYIGLDIDSPTARNRGIADYFYDGKKFPLDSLSFDIVLCNQVLEHVFNPSEFLDEINRVLKPNGKLILTVPFVWDEHEQPFDYARYSSFGLIHLLEKSGFQIIEHQKLCADISVIFQLINAYLYKTNLNLPKFPRLINQLIIMPSINLIGLALSTILPKNPDLFLDHAVLAEKIS